MHMVSTYRAMTFSCTALWLAALLLSVVTATSQIPAVADAIKAVDQMSGKDVEWFRNAITLAAIAFSAWMVKRKDQQTSEITVALLESAKSVQHMSSQVSELRQELHDSTHGK